MSRARVLVTGGAGFIGTRVKAQLVDRGADLVAVDHAWQTRDELTRSIGDRALDGCIHLGWYANPRDYLTAPAPNFRSLNDSIELVEVLGAVGCDRLVAAGSCAEYAAVDEAMDENSPVRPWSVYGATKAALHVLLESSWRPPGLEVTWARLFNVTGPGEHPDRLVPTVARGLLAGVPVDLSPGQQVRDYLDVDDVASALVELLFARVVGAVNVCSGEGISLRALLGTLADRVGSPDLLRFGERDYGAHDAMVVVGDNTRLRETGWRRAVSFSAMIDRVVDDWKERGQG